MDWIESLSKTIVEAADRAVAKAQFDRTSFGIVNEINGDQYKVAVFGDEYVIQSSKQFELHQRVAVTAPQGDFKHLLINSI